MNFVSELKWRGMIHDIMPGTEEFLLKEMGAHKIQGFLISRPTVAELAIKLIDQKWTY